MQSGIKAAGRDFAPSPKVDAVMAAERAASFTKRSIKSKSKLAGLKLALSMLDLTTLEGKDSPEKVRALCAKAVNPGAGQADLPDGLPSVAAVCVYPNLVKHCHDSLESMGALGRVKIASVATGFPSGQYPLDVRLDDTRRAIHDGADEIDMVINRGAFLAGRYDEVAEEIRAVKRTCLQEGVKAARHDGEGRGRPISLKVILETGELETLDNVRFASDLAIRAMDEATRELEPDTIYSKLHSSNGASTNGTGSNGTYESDGTYATNGGAAASFDFIKTSTGKVTPAATMPVTLVMLEAVRDWYLETGKLVGVKPAGGIRTAKQSLHYLVMVKETLGALQGVNELHAGGWLTPELWRFGASALANDILRQISWLHSGKYRANYDVTEA